MRVIGDGAEKFAKVVTRRYIHVADAEKHRLIAEILEELEALRAEAMNANAALRKVLEKVGA